MHSIDEYGQLRNHLPLRPHSETITLEHANSFVQAWKTLILCWKRLQPIEHRRGRLQILRYMQPANMTAQKYKDDLGDRFCEVNDI